MYVVFNFFFYYLTLQPSIDSRGKKNKAPMNRLQPAAGRDKFDEPSASFFPPPIPVWSTALRQVNRDPSNFLRPDINPTGVGYLFPEPASFTSIQDPAQRTTFFRTWLKYRPALLYRVEDPSLQVQARAQKQPLLAATSFRPRAQSSRQHEG